MVETGCMRKGDKGLLVFASLIATLAMLATVWMSFEGDHPVWVSVPWLASLFMHKEAIRLASKGIGQLSDGENRLQVVKSVRYLCYLLLLPYHIGFMAVSAYGLIHHPFAL